MRRLALSLLAVLLAIALLPACALADGDPASDVLLGQSVFYPYNPAVSQALQNALNGETAAASRAHFPIKVALIASPIDLGVIPQLFGKPQEYADFLEREISFQGPPLLLVVMATGYGVQGVSPQVKRAVAALRPPAGPQSNDLAQAAITAVAKMAAADGHPLNGSTGGSGGSPGSSSALIVAILAAAAIAVAAVLVGIRRRQATAR